MVTYNEGPGLKVPKMATVEKQSALMSMTDRGDGTGLNPQRNPVD